MSIKVYNKVWRGLKEYNNRRTEGHIGLLKMAFKNWEFKEGD